MTRLVSYSVEDVLSGGLVAENNPKPILIGARTSGGGPVYWRKHHFASTHTDHLQKKDRNLF